MSENNGMVCPRCGSRHMPAYRTEQERNKTIRYRLCDCGHRIVAKEEILRDVVPNKATTGRSGRTAGGRRADG